MTQQEPNALERSRQRLAQSQQRRREKLGLHTDTPAPSATRGSLHDIDPRQLTVDAETLPVVSYMLQHAGIGVLRSLSLHNRGGSTSQNLIVRVQLLPDEYGDAWEINIPEIAASESWSQDNIHLPLDTAKLQAVREKREAQLQITVVDDNGLTLYSAPRPIAVHAYNEWLFLPEAMHLLAAFCQPNHPALDAVIRQAVPRLRSIRGTSDFSGYQRGDTSHQLAMLEAIHQTLAEDFGLSYINPPASFEPTGQKIRLVDQLLNQGLGTCLDLAVLQASVWEQIGLHPVIVVIPGHALMALWQHEPKLETPVWAAANPQQRRLIDAALADASLLPINSTEVSMQQPLQQAIDTGAQLVQRALDNAPEQCHFIHIAAAHRLVPPLPASH